MMPSHQPRAGLLVLCGLAALLAAPSFAEQATDQITNQIGNLTNQENLPATAPEETKPEPFKFDHKMFVGERISISREYSSHIRSIQLTLTFPPQCSFSPEAPSLVNIFTEQEVLVAKADILGLKTHVLLGQMIESKHLYVQLMLNYSCEGEKASFKNILFDTPLVRYPKAEDIKLQYNFNRP